MTHRYWMRRRLGRSLRMRLAALLLGLVVLPTVFAELVAADVPVAAFGPGGMVLLPAVVAPARYRDKTAAQIAELHRGDLVLWPLVRRGPDTAVAAEAGAAWSWRHPLGTDARGRDVLALLVYGARTAFGLTLLALLASLLLGSVLGLLAGYAGGFWDELVSRPVELVETFPMVVVVAVVMAADPTRSAWSLLLAVTLVRWAEVARLVRTEVVRVMTQDYVTAARALGCGHLRIIYQHVLPQAVRPMLVSTMFGVASLVLLEVAVSFLGIGLEGSWGTVIADGLVPAGSGWAAGCAAALLALTVGAAYLLADSVGEALDARVAAQTPRPR